MGHGGYGKRKGAATIKRKKPAGQRRPKALAIDKKSKAGKPKSVTFKNQIRSIERMLRKDLPLEIKEAQENKLEELKRQQDIQNRLALERKIFLRYRRIKFFERRKIERRIRRLEKQQRASTGQAQEADITEQLSKLKEDLEYVKFFPKTEKYVSLYVGGHEAEIMEKRNTLRKQIKDNLIAAAASGKELEETGSEDDGALDPSDDDFFLNGSSSEEGEADDEWSARDQASGKAASGISSDERNQKLISARALMPPPGPSRKPVASSTKNEPKFAGYNKKPYNRAVISTSSNTSSINGRPTYDKKPYSKADGKKPYRRAEISTSSNTSSSSFGRPPPQKRGPVDSTTGTLSSNSDARKPQRKRRPKKKKQ
ncbi:rRNA-processing protein EFG1-like [Salvia splendens]|uniref:rRNA-processing protein EFG1-like n=1 Tax=Salvia splendens TaxID=180675 RepID=UPI001C265B7A|nr:rRNA-processing protein EFG1-like [Salvia splendens]